MQEPKWHSSYPGHFVLQNPVYSQLVAQLWNTVTWQIFLWGLAEWQQMAKSISFFHTESSMVVGIFLHLNLVDYSKYLGFLPGPEPPPLLLQLFICLKLMLVMLISETNFCALEIFARGAGVRKHCILEWVYWQIHWSAIDMVLTKDIEKSLQVFN